MELINYQPADTQAIELESRRSWTTDIYLCVYFNPYIQKEILKSLMKRVIINGMSGSRWCFERLERLSVIVTSYDKTTVLP